MGLLVSCKLVPTADAGCRDEPSITAAGNRRPPKSIALDIDDSADTVHGHQQLSRLPRRTLLMPIHVYDADNGHS
jgi:hypothetical protein